MFCKHIGTIIITVSTFLVHSLQETINPCSFNRNTAFVSALLPIHNEPNCTHVQLRGIQQMAALTKAVNQVNNDLISQEGITLSIQFHDTCSTTEGAVKAALRSLVETGQTCQQPPLLLGFIGLEDSLSLGAVRAITKMFNATHTTPYLLQDSDHYQNVLHVARQNYKEQAKSILSVVQKLQWKVVLLVFEDKMESLAQEVIEAINVNPSLCITGTVTRLTQEKINENIFKEAEKSSDGVIGLLDTPEMAVKLFQIQNPGNVSIIISINKVGLQTWQIYPTFSNLFILQQTSTTSENLVETMDSTLSDQYNIQEHSLCSAIKNFTFCETYQASNEKLSNSVDASITAFNYAIRLLGSGLRVAHRVQCRNLGEEVATAGLCERLQALNILQRQEFFKRSSSFTRSIDNPTSTGIHFDIELPVYYDLYNLNPINTKLVKIGKLRKSSIINTSDFVFPTSNTENKCPTTSQRPQQVLKTPVSYDLPETTLLDHLNLYKDYNNYQIIGLLCGVGVGMLIVMGIVIFGVYNMFRVRSGRSGKSSSVNTSPSVRRRHRGGSIASNRSL